MDDRISSINEQGEYDPYILSLTDEDGNHIESESGYRCVLTVADGQTVYRH